MTPLERAVLQAAKDYYHDSTGTEETRKALLAAVEALVSCKLPEQTVYFMTLQSLRLSTGTHMRARSIMEREGWTVQQLHDMTLPALLDTKNVGRTTAAVLAAAFRVHQISPSWYDDAVRMFGDYFVRLVGFQASQYIHPN